MSIVGHGVDIVNVARIDRSIEAHGEQFLARIFTDVERAYCEDRPKRKTEHYAARFAAKEAALKCIGTGWSKGIAWTDVGVVNDDFGVPRLVVAGKAREIADQMGISVWHVSLSHTSELAMASVIASSG